MKRTKTQEIVFGAMMLALYTMFMLIDRYTGGWLYTCLYYFLPLPFIVYGIKYGLGMFGVITIASVILGFIFGLAETAFFGVTAILVSYIIVSSIQKNWSGLSTMLLVMMVTVLSQVLSVTVFAALFGYDMMAEIELLVDMLAKKGVIIDAMRVRVLMPFSLVLLGCLEAFLFTTLSDLVLLRLKMARVAKFSIIQLHFPKIVPILYFVFYFLQSKINHDLILFGYLILWLMLLAQGVSYIFLLNATIFRKPIINGLSFIACFIPLVNYFIAGLGIIDIFSENRKNLLYNNHQRGEQ